MSSNTKNIKLSKARFAALNAVAAIRKNESFARNVLNKILEEHFLSNADKAFATKLTLGVTQMLGTLDDTIYRCVDSPDDIKDNVMDCLRISAYEILYLEKEAHAAVDQGVELVKVVEPRARGLANLVLRRIVKAKDEFPFGDPENDFEAFARLYAVPKWLCQHIFDSIGQMAGRYLISSCNGAPTCYIFVNLLKSSVEEMLDLLNKAHGKPQVLESLCGVGLNCCIRVDNPSSLQKLELKEAFHLGKYLICDAASQTIVTCIIQTLENPVNMLEVCSGKGNKSLMSQILAHNKFGSQLQYSVIDNIASKISVLQERARKCNVNVDKNYVVDASNKVALSKELGSKKYDCVFIDAPCSGLGTLRRHPELKWRLTINKIEELADIGYRILLNSAEYVNSGGILAYSTCTISKLENSKVIEKFLATDIGKNFKLINRDIKGNQTPYFYTQTYSGLNDTHFLVLFKRI